MADPMPPPPDPSRTGWYQDPGNPDGFRWWNGYEWTVQRAELSGNDGWPQRVRVGAMVAAAIVVVAAIAGSSGSTGTGDPVAVTGSESFQSRCQPVPGTLIDSIEEGLTTNGPGTLRNAQAVNSGDFESVWFIAADIQAEGIDDGGDVGVWAVTGTLESPGLTFAVDAVANEFQIGPMAVRRTPNSQSRTTASARQRSAPSRSAANDRFPATSAAARLHVTVQDSTSTRG